MASGALLFSFVCVRLSILRAMSGDEGLIQDVVEWLPSRFWWWCKVVIILALYWLCRPQAWRRGDGRYGGGGCRLRAKDAGY